MCIIQIWTTNTCSGAPKLVEKSHVCPWVNFLVPCKRWEWNSNIWASWIGQKDWETWFLIPVNPKHAWKSWNLAWCHDMAPTCCDNFSVPFAKAHTLTINKVILEQVLSRYKLETQVLLKPWAFDLPITCGHASLFLFARKCRAG